MTTAVPEVRLHLGDCSEVMRGLAPGSVDAVVTDPPYGLKFMGKEWDHGVPGISFWTQAIRVAKPGAYLLAFGGTRTFHRLACAIEDAGWEIRDCVMWVYGSGFPKSRDASKAIDRVAGVAIESRGHFRFTSADDAVTPGTFRTNDERKHPGSRRATPSTDAARQWDGWGTALKPAWEPIIVARKPLDGTVAANVLKWGTGAMNIDASRVGLSGDENMSAVQAPSKSTFSAAARDWTTATYKPEGRWPANLIHDGSDEVLAGFPSPHGAGHARNKQEQDSPRRPGWGNVGTGDASFRLGDSGSAARFFYCVKASRKERGKDNNHPTVKPVALMRYLCRLVTQPGGTILDPFMGSGSTGYACAQEGLNFMGVEIDPGYFKLARKRIAEARLQRRLAL